MDALSDVLRVVNLSGGVFLNAEFNAPWCMIGRLHPKDCGPTMRPSLHLIPYHFVVSGEIRVKIIDGDGSVVTLRAGDVVLMPHNEAHLMGSDISLPPVPADKIIMRSSQGGLSTIRLDGAGPRTILVCGFLGSATPTSGTILSTLPSLLKLKAEDAGAAEWIRSTFSFAAQEVAAGRAGSETVLAKLSELLFVEAVRRYAETLPENQNGWLAGLRDPQVGRALALLHSDIRRQWSVDDLGREVGMSRSALAERFTRLIGQPPIQYLGHWRMQVAAQQLRETNALLAQVSERVGFESEAAFSRAFKREFGIAPATWRRTQVQG